MEILAVCVGSAGDVLPFLTIGRALKTRGHRVTILANGYFRALVKSSGLAFAELGKKEQQLRAMNHPKLYDPKDGPDIFYRTLLQPIVQPVCEKIEAGYHPKKTIVLASRFAFGVALAREKVGVPVLTLALTPFALTSGKKVSFFSPDGVLGLFPSWFGAPESNWPPHVRLAGFPMDLSLDSTLWPATLETFLTSGAPPILFTSGTAMRHAGHFFKESLKGCIQIRERGLFVTPFSEQIPKLLPSDFLHVRSASFGRLFRRVKAVVHAGGIGTSAEGMAAGIPQLLVPLAYDQFDNAERLKKLGVALSMDRDAYQAPAVAKHLTHLTQSRFIQKRCQGTAKKLRTDDSIRKACDMIEAYEDRFI